MSSGRHQWSSTNEKVTSCRRCGLVRVFGNHPRVYRFDYCRGDYPGRASLEWMTGVHVIETAESMVSAAHSDGSLKDEREKIIREES